LREFHKRNHTFSHSDTFGTQMAAFPENGKDVVETIFEQCYLFTDAHILHVKGQKHTIK